MNSFKISNPINDKNYQRENSILSTNDNKEVRLSKKEKFVNKLEQKINSFTETNPTPIKQMISCKIR